MIAGYDAKNVVLSFIERGDIFPVQENVYFSLVNLDSTVDLECARRRLLKNKDLLLKYFDPRQVEALNVEIEHFSTPSDVTITRKDGWTCFRLSPSERVERHFRKLRGWRWKAPLHVFPSENAMRALRIVESCLRMFIDDEIPEACFAIVQVVPELMLFKVVILIEHEIVFSFLNSCKIRSLIGVDTYEVKIDSIEELSRVTDLVVKTNGAIRFLGGYPTRISILKEFLVQKNANASEITYLSSAGSTEISISSPEGCIPYQFQVVGVQFLRKTNARTLIADEMGLGKTIMTSLLFYNYPVYLPAIIVVPSSVKVNWSREVKKWVSISSDDIQMIIGAKQTEKNKIEDGKKIYIINYAILAPRLQELLKLHVKTVVFDEAHYVKNYKSARTKSACELAKNFPHAICLTGTPIINKPIDLWSILIITRAVGEFGGFKQFTHKYCGAYESRFGYNVDGATNLDELQSRLRETVMIRRLKRDVIPELPPKRRIVVPISITNRAMYERAANNFHKWYKENGGNDPNNAEAMVKIEVLKQIIYKGKETELVNFINDVTEQRKKIIVFFSHRDSLSSMKDKLKLIIRGFTLDALTQSESAEKRQEIADYFNSQDRCVLLCSIHVANFGINLQTADTVIFTELGWTSTLHNQAEDRAHRIGLENDVNVYYIVGENTIEEKIVELLNSKQEIIDNAVGSGGDVTGDFISWFAS